jgi:hypothetical protein
MKKEMTIAKKFKEIFDILENMKKLNDSKEIPLCIYGTM